MKPGARLAAGQNSHRIDQIETVNPANLPGTNANEAKRTQRSKTRVLSLISEALEIVEDASTTEAARQ